MTDEKNNIWAKICSEERPHMLVPFPRNNPETGLPYCQLAMVLLTAEEAAMVTAEAEKKCKKILKDDSHGSAGYEQLYKDFLAEGVVYKSCRHPDALKRNFFPDSKSVSRVLTTDELAILINHYGTIQMDMGPVIADLSGEEMEEWIEKIKSSAQDGRFFLNSFSEVALKELVIFMANLLPSLQTLRSWRGSQQSDSTASDKKEEKTKKEEEAKEKG